MCEETLADVAPLPNQKASPLGLAVVNLKLLSGVFLHVKFLLSESILALSDML
jgi:hypothetical protein